MLARASHSVALCHAGKFVGSSVGVTSVMMFVVIPTPCPNNFDVPSASSSAVVIHRASCVPEYEWSCRTASVVAVAGPVPSIKSS